MRGSEMCDKPARTMNEDELPARMTLVDDRGVKGVQRMRADDVIIIGVESPIEPAKRVFDL